MRFPRVIEVEAFVRLSACVGLGAIEFQSTFRLRSGCAAVGRRHPSPATDAPTFEEIADTTQARSVTRWHSCSRYAHRTGTVDPVARQPGTAKSLALRALVRRVEPWCSAHFIMDPDQLLGRGGAYILDVLTWTAAMKTVRGY